MADTITTNYHWVKPAISGSPTTWGVKWNADLDDIDAQMFWTTGLATQAVHDSMQVGMVVMFAGATPPPNWKLCDGTVYLNTAIPLLAPILNNAYGGVAGTSNAVPDLRQKFPTGYSVGVLGIGATGGEATHVLTTAEMPAHNHTFTPDGHSHAIENTDHAHAYGDATGATTTVQSGTGVTLTQPAGVGSTSTESIPDIAMTIESQTGAIGNTGGGGAHNNLPPFTCVNFIIKYQ